MSIGPFLARELAVSARGERAFGDRRVSVILAGSTFLGCLMLWDRQGWDRSSSLGANRFGLAMFAVLVFGMMMLAFGVILQQVASAIASERDRKSLDALLASRFSSFEIILGAVMTGLFRYANALAASLPVIVLIIYLGGVAPIWAILAGLGLASTASLLAGFSVAASVGARTRTRAVVVSSGLFAFYFAFPPMYLLFLRPRLWPNAPTWLNDLVLAALDGSPMGLLMNLLRLMPRPGGPIEAVGRMAAWQLAWSLVLIAWATFRLRPASRGLYDVEGERGRIKQIKAALRRAPRRPPCGDAPAYWLEAYSSRVKGIFEKLTGRIVVVAIFAVVALATGWTARPAFAELFARGYGPSPEAFDMPELHPIMRLMIKARIPSITATAFPGQQRLEFNMSLRLFGGAMILWFASATLSVAFEAIKGERRRDTWLGLIATPLTAREILRGKALGSLWKLRWGVVLLVAPATVGLVAGAVHPLGYLLSLGFLAATGLFYSSLGLSMALHEYNPETQAKAAVTLKQVPAALVGSVVLTVGPVVMAWATLLTYEDVAAAIRGGPFPELREGSIGEIAGARGVTLFLLAATGLLGFGAWWLARANERGFDKAIGRPVRARSDGRPRIEQFPGSINQISSSLSI